MQLKILIKVLMDNNDFFDRFKEDEIGELLKCCSPMVFNDGDIIFSENTMGQDFFIIIKGSVLVTIKGKKIDIVRDGECIGEMGAISGKKRSATAEAIGKATMLKINDMNISSLQPHIQAKLYKNIALLVANRLRKRLERVQ